jgi:MarR family transcriptional regulator, lower aerobic nicotinate degradation pathway regulator
MTGVEEDRRDYDPPRRLRRLPSWLTGELARRAQRLVGEALAQEGARRQHFTVLTSLAEQGAASQAALGRALWIDRSDLHAILNELERDGLIARIRDEQDRRRNLVTLTPSGTAALKRLDKRVDAAQSALLKPLSATDRRELVRLLEQLVDHDQSGLRARTW